MRWLKNIFKTRKEENKPKPDNLPYGCMWCKQFTGKGCTLTGKTFWENANVAVRPKGCPLVAEAE